MAGDQKFKRPLIIDRPGFWQEDPLGQRWVKKHWTNKQPSGFVFVVIDGTKEIKGDEILLSIFYSQNYYYIG